MREKSSPKNTLTNFYASLPSLKVSIYSPPKSKHRNAKLTKYRKKNK